MAVTGEIPDVRTVPARRAVVHPTLAQLPIAIVLAKNKGEIKMGMWSSRHGKFKKRDPDHGWLGKKIARAWNKFKHWFCNVGLCNINKCKCFCHEKNEDRP